MSESNSELSRIPNRVVTVSTEFQLKEANDEGIGCAAHTSRTPGWLSGIRVTDDRED